MTTKYELMVILDPGIDERTVAPSLDRFLGVIRQSGGTVGKVDVWGRRRLAYEIDKHGEGIYAVVDLDADTAAVQELDRQLGLSEAVLRTKVLRADVAVATASSSRGRTIADGPALPAPRPPRSRGPRERTPR